MSEPLIVVDIAKQHLTLESDGSIVMDVPVSTAINGAGEEQGSECTPRGRHIIRAKIGEECPVNSVFVARRPTGEIYNRELDEQFPGRDWILTRILWLSGLEVGKNRLGSVDTMRRFIYIHGTPDDVPLGVPASHGCVRMRNSDIIDLFDRVAVGTRVHIVNHEQTDDH